MLVFSEEPVEGLEGIPPPAPGWGRSGPQRFRGLVTSKDASPEVVERLSEACSSVEEDERFARFQDDNLAVSGSYIGAEEFDGYLQVQLRQIEDLDERCGVGQ